MPIPATHEDSSKGSQAQSDARAVDRAFLERIPSTARSHVANLFLEPIRNGEIDAERIVASVADKARAELFWARRSKSDRIGKWESILVALAEHRDEALACAVTYVAWERLPGERRELVKAERQAGYRSEWMSNQPVTVRQLRYLRSLGVPEVDLPSDKAAASSMIDERLRAACR
jgi:hypothetical protein